MPGGGGAWRSTAATVSVALSESRSRAGVGGGDFGDVPVFGMIIWMPILQSLMNQALAALMRPQASRRVSILPNLDRGNPGGGRKESLTIARRVQRRSEPSRALISAFVGSAARRMAAAR